MAYASGIETRAAAVKGSTWGTAAACGAGDGLLILPPTLKKQRDALLDDSLGAYFPVEADQGPVKVEGDLPCYLRYDGLDLLIALVAGATGGAPVQQGTTTAYAQSFSLAENTDGLFCTLALLNGVNVDEYPTLKLTGLTLKGRVGEPLEISFSGISSDRVTDSSTNTPATMGSVTIAESGNRVLMSQGVFRMNDASGAALDSGDAIYPSSFELSFMRKMAGACGSGLGYDRVDEPAIDGQPEIKLKLEFPRYTSGAHFEDWDSAVPKKMDMAFTGTLIEDSYYREFRLSFPNLAYKGVELPMDRGALKHPVEFACLAASSAPLGMAGITKPFRTDVVNTESTDVLA
jgi:hypothetical protein